MGWKNFIADAFYKQSSRRIRLALSILFISLMTAIVMIIFQEAKSILDPGITLSESQLYSIVFISVMAPIIALFVLLWFEKLYERIAEENQERKRAGEALSKNLSVLARSQEIAHLGSWTIDFDSGMFEVSDEIYRMHGFEPGAIESTLELSTKLTHPDDLEKYKEYAESIRRDGRPVDIDYRVVWPDGSIHYVHARTDSIVRGPDGRVKIASGITQDITERKQAEEALRESEERFRALIQNSSDIIRILDRKGRIVYESSSSEKILGYHAGDMLGKTPIDYVHPDDRERVRDELNQVYRGANPGIPTEFRIRKANGDYLEVESTGMNMIGVPGVDGIVINTRPITERKRAEEALRESKARLEAVFSSMNDAILIFDADGKATSANHAAVQFHRFRSKDELLTSLNGYIELLDTRNLDGTRLTPDKWPISRALKGEVVFNENIAITRKDTGESWVGNSSAAPIRDDSGNVVAAVITMRDVTEQKRAEEALREAKMQAELYLDLMGHDINNMHQIVLGYLEIAEGMISPDDGRREYIEKPIEVLQRSAQLIKNVRKLQKLREGGFQSQEVEVSQLLVDVQREFGSIPHKSIMLKLNGCDHCHVQANELLHDVFANMVSNAIKHTGDRADIAICLDLINVNGNPYCRVSVEDDGPGVPDDFKPTIFNRVLKGTRKAKGMGIGLYLVKSLVESYNGKVWVEDRVAADHTKGARFVVMLPAVESN